MSRTFFLFGIDCDDTFYQEKKKKISFRLDVRSLCVDRLQYWKKLNQIAENNLYNPLGGNQWGELNEAYRYWRAKGRGVCNTAKFGFEPIPSNYRASIAATNTNPDNRWYSSEQLMYFHVGDSSIFLWCKITPALNSPQAMIGDGIGRQPNVSCVSYGLLLLAESCDGTTTERRSGSEEEEEEPSASCKTAFSQTWLFFVEARGRVSNYWTLMRDWDRSSSPTVLALIRHKYQHWCRYLDRSTHL